MVPQVSILPLLFILKNFYLFICYAGPQLRHVGSSSLSRGWTRDPVWGARSPSPGTPRGSPTALSLCPRDLLCVCPPRWKAYFSGSFATRYGHLTKAGKWMYVEFLYDTSENLFFKVSVMYSLPHFFKIIFLLKDNCFTGFCCFLSNLNVNQP